MDATNAPRRPRRHRRWQTATATTAATARCHHTVVASLLLLSVVLLLSCTPVVDAGRREITWRHATNPNDEPSPPTATTVDATGDLIVCGCHETETEGDDQGHTFYVTKFSARGHQIWRQEFPSTTSGGADACATAITSDAALNLYITGTVKSSTTVDGDVDVFVAKVSPLGSLIWLHTLSTRYRDVATSIRAVTSQGTQLVDKEQQETSIIIGGYSRGTLSLGKASPSNCEPETNAYTNSECDDGFVVKLSARDGLVQWIQSVAGAGGKRTGETRVFDVGVGVASEPAYSDGVLVVVGETHGELRTTLAASERHAGNVFVRRLNLRTGETLWTTQLGASSPAGTVCQLPASATSPSSYTRHYPRGRCALAIHRSSQEISIVATTHGLLSTFPSQKLQYETICGANTNTKSKPSACLQLVVARVQLATGAVQWVRQLIHASSTSAEAALAVSNDNEDEDDLVVLGTASAGFFSSTAESMEQLLVMRLARDGVVQWTTELGLDGEDHAVAIVGAGGGKGENEQLFALSHGSADKTQRGQPSTQSSIQRINARDGSVVPVCVDLVTFDKTQRVDVSRVSDPPATPSSTALRIQFPVQRDPVRLCADATASVGYRYHVADSVSDISALMVSTGRVHFASGQTTATLVVVVGTTTASVSTRTLHVVLEPIESDTQVESNVAAIQEWSVQLLPDDDGAVAAHATTQGEAAADGRLWQQLTWLLLVVAVVGTVLVVVVGRVGCVGGAWRKAKVFQYKTLRMRRPSSSSSPSSPTAQTTNMSGLKARARARQLLDTSVAQQQQDQQQHGNEHEEQEQEEEETDELRSHLEEIQQLNQSLSGLLQQQQQHSSGSTSTSTSPRASVSRLALPSDETTAPARSPTIKKKNAWKRSTRALLPSQRS